MGDVTKIHGDLMEVWDYAFCYIKSDGSKVEGQEQLQAALNEGYEPYSVTHWMEQNAASALSSIQPKAYMIEKHHLRRKHLVKVPAPTQPLLPPGPKMG